MPENSTTAPLLLGAVIIGGAVLAGSWMVKSAVATTGDQIRSSVTATSTEITNSLAETKTALERVASSKGNAAPPRRGPDPNKKYTIKTAGAPAKGGMNAKVQIVEFSDFQ